MDAFEPGDVAIASMHVVATLITTLLEAGVLTQPEVDGLWKKAIASAEDHPQPGVSKYLKLIASKGSS